MASILETKNRLPKQFIEKLYENYTPLTVDKILAGMSGERAVTIRTNNIKCNIQELMKHLKGKNIKFDRVQWYKDALIIKNAKEKDLQKLEIYEKGFFYLQSLSSMIPTIILNPKEKEKILDLTAAPGSKTTQIASMMNNKGYILANELDYLRCERLKYNVEKQGASIVEVINKRGENIGKEYKEQFDKVLLDAPCSGEGRFSVKDVKTYRTWSLKTVTTLAKMQKKLLKSAYEALKQNGEMIYSTCTLNKEENEYIIDWAIKNLNLKILDIDIEIKEKMNGITQDINKEINKCIRILPSKMYEGFFITKFKKIC